jgi:hypothetical protein
MPFKTDFCKGIGHCRRRGIMGFLNSSQAHPASSGSGRGLGNSDEFQANVS